MASYTVQLEQTVSSDITSIDLTMSYIADPSVDCKIYVNGSLLTVVADYTISDVVQYPYFTTFKVNFLNVVVAASVLRVEKNDEYNQWIQYKFPNIDTRLDALEAKLGAATNIASRLLVLETNLANAQADIVTNSSLISGHNLRINTLESDVDALTVAVNSNIADINALESFLGIEGSVAIDNNAAVPILIPALTTDGYQFSSVKVDYEIMRRTGTEYRSSVGSLYLVCKDNGVWFTERGLQIVDLDGVTFSIATDPNRVGSISYISDLMLGAGYVGYFKFRTTKFGV